MAVTASMVKELREMTGAGMMDCKKALSATDGDLTKLLNSFVRRDLLLLRRKQEELPLKDL